MLTGPDAVILYVIQLRRLPIQLSIRTTFLIVALFSVGIGWFVDHRAMRIENEKISREREIALEDGAVAGVRHGQIELLRDYKFILKNRKEHLPVQIHVDLFCLVSQLSDEASSINQLYENQAFALGHQVLVALEIDDSEKFMPAAKEYFLDSAFFPQFHDEECESYKSIKAFVKTALEPKHSHLFQ